LYRSNNTHHSVVVVSNLLGCQQECRASGVPAGPMVLSDNDIDDIDDIRKVASLKAEACTVD
jgi:hypothetical protein